MESKTGLWGKWPEQRCCGCSRCRWLPWWCRTILRSTWAPSLQRLGSDGAKVIVAGLQEIITTIWCSERKRSAQPRRHACIIIFFSCVVSGKYFVPLISSY